MTREQSIIRAIDESPLNRGLRGADWIATPGNVAYKVGADLALFDAAGESTYEVHFLFASRGREAIRLARDAFRHLFLKYDAKLIFGLTPTNLRHARLMARWAGGKSAGIRPTVNGPCELFVLSNEMWSATQ